MRTAHPREQLGNRLICDSLAISYSRDIDDTIAEEDEVEEEEDNSRGSSSRSRANNNQEARRRTGNVDGDDDDDDAMSNGHAALLEQVVIGGSGRSRSGGVRRGRGHSRSVSPGSRAPQQQQHHDYVNSAPGSRFLEDTIPAIPPPPQSSAKFQKQQKQQFFSVQPGAGADSDPYGKEFDAIGSRVPATAAVNPPPSSTGSRINGRVLPPEVRKEQQLAIPPRLRNGFVPGSSSGSGGSGGV